MHWHDLPCWCFLFLFVFFTHTFRLRHFWDVKPYHIIFTNPSARAGYDTRSIFKRSLTDLNLEFSFSSTSLLTKAEEPSLPNYLHIARGRIIRFIPFPRVLVLCEMQSVSSRFWTRIAVSIPYDDNHYTTGTSKKALCIVIRFLVLWSIGWRSSLVHFKNGPGYLSKETTKVLIPLMRFLLCSLAE